MRRAGSSVLGALLLAAVQLAAVADEAAPLEATKKELQQLQSAQKTKAGAIPAEGLKMDAPVLEMPKDSLGTSERWLAKKNKADLKREQQRRESENWLVNGVNKLGQETATGAAGKDAATAASPDGQADGSELDPLDPSDPQYLLKLFDEQKKRPDAKQAEARLHATPAADPFAPFLQSWLGTSPVRDQVLDQYAKKGELDAGVPALVAVPDYRATGASPVVTVAGREAPGGDKPNPYLIELNAPLLPAKDPSGGFNPAPAIDPSVLAPAANGAPAMIAPLDPLPDLRPPAKGPPPSPADDKKYFPQLKKF
jgi:hypothetical protein